MERTPDKGEAGGSSPPRPTKSVPRHAASASAQQQRGRSSAGRAPALHAGGQEFDPPRLHQVPSSGFRWPLGARAVPIQQDGVLEEPTSKRGASCSWTLAPFCEPSALFTIRSMKLSISPLRGGDATQRKATQQEQQVRLARRCSSTAVLAGSEPNCAFARKDGTAQRKVTGDVRLPCGPGSRGLGYMVKRTSAFGGCLGS